MLKSICFTFSSPICKCRKNNIVWGWGEEDFYIRCETCETRWEMPSRNTRALVIFEKPYPDGDSDKNNILRIIK